MVRVYKEIEIQMEISTQLWPVGTSYLKLQPLAALIHFSRVTETSHFAKT